MLRALLISLNNKIDMGLSYDADEDDEARKRAVVENGMSGEALDKGVWERSKRKMEEKARLYAAMKRGDVEDADERYAVDFDAKWAEARAAGKEDEDDEDDYSAGEDEEQVEYVDELGRTRTGTRLDALRAKQEIERQSERGSTKSKKAGKRNRAGNEEDAIDFDPFAEDLDATPRPVGRGTIIAVDLLRMEPILGVKTLQMDFLSSEADEVIMHIAIQPYPRRYHYQISALHIVQSCSHAPRSRSSASLRG